MRTYSAKHGPMIQETGKRMIKRPNPVYMLGPMHDPFRVETNEGKLAGGSGDFLAYDPISGHVWPVSASYVAQHYDEAVSPPESDERQMDPPTENPDA